LMASLANLFVVKFTMTGQILAGNLNPEVIFAEKLAKKFLNKVKCRANNQQIPLILWAEVNLNLKNNNSSNSNLLALIQ
jgi:signal transduction histidine kinase